MNTAGRGQRKLSAGVAVGLLSVAVLSMALVAGSRADARTLLAANEGKIGFVSDRDSFNTEIYVMNADGSGQTRLTRDAFAQDPTWSPDGTRIAFTKADFFIVVMNADGSGQTRLNSDSSDDLAWSPDGTKLAFASQRTSLVAAGIASEIYVINATGGGETRLTQNSAPDFDPAWSPDGRKIAFDSNRDGNYEIYVMNADGSGPTRLTQNAVGDDGPAWSPDGRKIAFASERDGNWEIYVMNADGSGPTRLTQNEAADDGFPAWSPDGTKIAFNTNREGNYEIYVMNADGSGQTNLTQNAASDRDSAWWGTAPDTTSPTLALTARSPQRVLTQKGVILSASCDEACTLKASGTIAILGQRTRLPLRPASGTLDAPGRQTLKLGLSSSAQKRLSSLFRQGRRASATVSVRAVDKAGNASTAKRTVSARR